MNTPGNNGLQPGQPAAPAGSPAPPPAKPGAEASNAPAAGQIPWRRPAPVSRETNVRSWLIFLAVLCLAVALWTPLRSFYYRPRYRPAAAAGVADASCFVALAYSGVADEILPGSMDITPAAFEEQIKILRERGYTPIGLEDVLEF